MRDPFDPYPSLGVISRDSAEYDHAAGQPAPDEERRDLLAVPEEPRPLRALVTLAVLVGLILVWRLLNLQLVEGTKNRVLAEGNRIRSREIRPPRGEIRDARGEVLASNVASFALEIYPAELPRKRAEREALLNQVAAATGLELAEARTQLESQGLVSLEPIRLAEDITRDTALIWQAKLVDQPGVSVTKTPRRTYAELPGLGHILGYVGRLSAEDRERWPDRPLASDVGKTGLEAAYEEKLQGTPGQKRIEVDAKGRVERVLAELAPVQGAALTLTLDARLQAALVAQLEAVRADRAAAAVALDTRTGGILALASLPSFDPNVFVRGDRASERQALLSDERRPLVNRVTGGSYPSGSTIKPFIATAALTEGTITDRTVLDTSAGVIEIGQWRFPDWKVHGLTDVRQAIAESNDIFFYALGGGWQHIAGLGPERLKNWLKNFGFGSATGVDLPGEASGLVPDEAWKRDRFDESWYIGDSYHLAIGQGFFLTTPLQLARATAAVANGGTLVTPHLAASNQAVGVETATALEHRPAATAIAPPDILAIVREGMRRTVTEGTARSLSELPVPVAGKTGTAQFGPQTDGQPATHSWFTGFAPADSPEIALAVIVEGGGESSDTAVPAAKAFLLDWASRRGS